MTSFIVQLWSTIFACARYIFVFEILRLILRRKFNDSLLVDAFVLGNTVLATSAAAFSPLRPDHWWTFTLVGYGCLRVVEIFVYQVNVLLWDPKRAREQGNKYQFLSYRRALILGLHNYAEIVLWFAAIYGVCNEHFNDPQSVLAQALGCVYFSVVTITTLGYGDVTPTDAWGWFLVVTQTTVGVFMALLIFSRFVGLLPRPGSIQDDNDDDTPG
jgi:hypothetical protein